MAVRKREDEVFPNAAGIDVGASSHWVAVPRHVSDDSVREFGAMTVAQVWRRYGGAGVHRCVLDPGV